MYYQTWAEEVEPQSRGPEQQVALNQMEEELPNIRLALDWAAQHAEIEFGMRLLTMTWRMWYQRGYLMEGRQRVDVFLRHPAVVQVDPHWRANATSIAGWLAFGQGNYAEAAKQHGLCLAIRRSLQQTSGIASSLEQLSDQLSKPTSFIARAGGLCGGTPRGAA
ncbi:MAG: hypothetical protein IVW57_18755, partial [Ktedonobacterales bacterium]|nr:hypothetical protein [Ktedonobacterales bacterium]